MIQPKPKITGTNILAVLVAGLGSFMFGYSNNIIAGSLAQTSFIEKFLSGENADSVTNGILGGFLAGGLIGSVAHAPISEKYGRKVTTGVASILIVIAGALMAGSIHIAMFIVGRILSGIGGGMLTSNCPVYLTEISPPHIRGMLTSVHGVAITLAYILSSLLALAFHFVEHSYQWRLPFVCYTSFGLLLPISLLALPESPRWLMEQGRYKEAQSVLEHLHKSGSDSGHDISLEEYAQIKAQLDIERILPTSYWYIIRNSHTRKRMICSILVWVMNMGTGVLVIANLAPELFSGLGFSVTLQLGLSVVWVVCAAIGASINSLLLDKFGRIKLFAVGGYMVTIILIIEAVLEKYYLGTTNTSGLNAATGMFFIYIIFWGSLVDNTTYVYVPEIWPTHLRSKGSSIGFVTYYSTAIALNTPASTAFATIGYKYYFVFVAFCVVTTTCILFYCPETTNLTLEQIGTKFGDEVRLADDSCIGNKEDRPVTEEKLQS